MKYMGKITDMFGRLKFWLPLKHNTYCFKAKLMLQVGQATYRVTDVSFRHDGKVWAEKYSKVFLWNAWNVLTRMRRRKKLILYNRGRDNQITTGAKLLDIKYEFYGFSGDLIETIN